MPGQYTRLQFPYKIASDNVNPTTSKNEIPRYRGVIQAGEGICKLPTADNAVPLGVVDMDELVDDPLRDPGEKGGRTISVKVEGIASIKVAAGETIAAGDRVILGTGGFAKKLPAGAGQYNVIGFAEKGGVGDNGDIIPVRMAYHTWNV